MGNNVFTHKTKETLWHDKQETTILTVDLSLDVMNLTLVGVSKTLNRDTKVKGIP